MKKLSDVVKEIRLANGLTQKQFAKKFFVTEKTISNYENDVRKPDFNFLTNVCHEFNVTLDTFFELPKNPSSPWTLVESYKNGKKAIFDRGQSVYLTPHVYDDISIDPYNYHTVRAYLNGDMDSIVFYGIVDNWGNVTEVKDYYLSSCFSEDDVAPAYNRNNGLYYLITPSFEKVSKGYIHIYPFIREEYGYNLFFVDGYPDSYEGLVNFDESMIKRDISLEKYRNKENYLPRALLTSKGEEIPLTFFRDCGHIAVSEYLDIDKLCSAVEKFSPGILQFAPKKVFEDGDNIVKIIKATISHYKKYIKTADRPFLWKRDRFRACLDKLCKEIEFYADECLPSLPTEDLTHPNDDLAGENLMIMTSASASLCKLYKRYFREKYPKQHSNFLTKELTEEDYYRE